ncbi:hypothetical protein DFJ58DRAFT_802002 [Suillus subalutaceus]|uniref:uncharacterized protein n=1 Tax=Suillus subalutaceus TaxID=48586 RepID=UPI001B864BAE|nr:uncharacterized protein DFJ58DRAFT_802002 [Suillus subalutaceus]KAG1844832.1 hypothetical protein DFJ58DRAFT_802002 [Suillus subalutaceus]KAG1856450.1 hypothetical protein F4604DRAFT_1213202 [Suillus subluteus]
MALLSTIAGFSLFGLAARFGQLAIKKRNLMENLGGHALSMGVFGYAGYWAYQWDERAAVMLAQKRAEITERRERKLAQAA